MAVIALAIASVCLSAIAQLLLKLGMSSQSVQAGLAAGGMDAALRIAFNPFVLGGLALYGFGAVLWLFVLARFDLSKAYPFVGLGFIFTMLFGAWLLNEQVTLMRVTGTLLVVGGVVLVAHS